MIYAIRIAVVVITLGLFGLWILLGLGWLLFPSHRATLSMARFGGLFDDWLLCMTAIMVLDRIGREDILPFKTIGGRRGQ